MSDDGLGPCCACGGADNIRNVMMLHKRAPVPGTGWGCIVCGLPLDGAVAVLCDHCIETQAPITQACVGYPGAGLRVSIETLVGEFDHDEAKHTAYDLVRTHARGHA